MIGKETGLRATNKNREHKIEKIRRQRRDKTWSGSSTSRK